MPRTSKKQALKGIRYAAAIKVDNSTVMYFRKNGEKVFRVHQVDLITVYPNGSMRFDTQGQFTYLQLRRINQLQALIVVSKEKKSWHFCHANDVSAWRKNLPVFYDGLTIDSFGDIVC